MGEYIVVSGKMRPGLHPLEVAPGSHDLRTALITYHGLPSGPHSLGRQSAVEVWRSISGFLADCAMVLHQRQELSIHHLGRKPTRVEQEALDHARSRYGKPSQHKTGPRGEMREKAFLVRPDQMADAVEWVVSKNAMPPIDLGYGWVWPSVGVRLSVLFTLADLRTGVALPFQGTEHYGGQGFDGYCASGLGESLMNVGLTNGKSHCYAALSLPFEAATEGLWMYVEELQCRLPFKFSDKHWRLWRLNEAGTAYQSTKIQPGSTEPARA